MRTMTDAPLPAFLTVKDAARYTGLSARVLWRLLAEGAIERHKVGRRTLVNRAELEAYIGSRGARGAA